MLKALLWRIQFCDGYQTAMNLQSLTGTKRVLNIEMNYAQRALDKQLMDAYRFSQ